MDDTIFTPEQITEMLAEALATDVNLAGEVTLFLPEKSQIVIPAADWQAYRRSLEERLDEDVEEDHFDRTLYSDFEGYDELG